MSDYRNDNGRTDDDVNTDILDAVEEEKKDAPDKASGQGTPESGAGKGGQGSHVERYCSMCRRPESQTSGMLQLPGGLNICTDCMQKSFDSFNSSGLDINSLPKDIGQD